MKRFVLSDEISAEEIQLYRDYVGMPWQKTEELENVAEKIKQIWDKVDLLGQVFCSNALGNNFHVTDRVRTCLDQSGGRAGPKKFRHYLLVRIKHKESEFKDELYYWLSAGFNRDEESKIVQKEKFRIRLALGISDQDAPKDIKDIFRKILIDNHLECIVEDVENKTIEEIEKILFEEFKKFKKSFDQIVHENREGLKSIKTRKKIRDMEKDTTQSNFKHRDKEFDCEEDLVSNKIFSTKNLIFYGPPGTGKTYHLQELKEQYKNRCEFVTFHQSYGYEEFVEGLRPVLAEDSGFPHSSDGSGQVKYKIEPGIFKRLCDNAASDKDNRYAIFIDEINRGNISKIFGELISLIEIDKREKLKITLAYSKKSFTVPKNIDIIGTMNTADRSLALIDTALRRRFEFKALYPDTREEKDPNDKLSAPLSGLMVGEIDIRKMLKAINDRIELLYDLDHCIGHAYFTGLLKNEGELESDDSEERRFMALKHIFLTRIRPLLEEYFFENWKNIRRVLGDDSNKPKDLQFLHEITNSDDRDLFDDGFENERFRYRWNDDAFKEPEAYIRIYSNLKKQVSL